MNTRMHTTSTRELELKLRWETEYDRLDFMIHQSWAGIVRSSSLPFKLVWQSSLPSVMFRCTQSIKKSFSLSVIALRGLHRDSASTQVVMAMVKSETQTNHLPRRNTLASLLPAPKRLGQRFFPGLQRAIDIRLGVGKRNESGLEL